MADFDPDKFLAKGGFDPDAFLAKKEPEEKSTFRKALDVLDYGGRIGRTALAAPLSKDFSAGDVWDQAQHLYPENAPKKAPSGAEVAGMAGVSDEKVKFNKPEFVGDYATGALVEGVGRTIAPLPLVNLYKQYLESKGTTFQDVAGVPIEMAADASNIVPFGAVAKGVSKGVKGLSGAVKSGAVKGISAIAEKGIDLAGRGVKATGEALQAMPGEGTAPSYLRSMGSAIGDVVQRSAPKLSPKLEKLSKVAEGIGVEVSDAVKFGRDSDIARGLRVQADLPGGEQIRLAHNAATQKIGSSIEDTVSSLSKGRISPDTDFVEAGARIVEDFEGAQNALKNKIDFDRGMVYQTNPNIQFTEDVHSEMLKRVEKTAKQLGKARTTAIKPDVKDQAKNAESLLLEVYTNLSSSNKMQDAHKNLQYLGEVAFGAENSTANAQVKKSLREAYFDLAEVFDVNTKNLLGEDIAKSVEESNKLWKEWYKSGKDFDNIMSLGSPEQVFKRMQSANSVELEKFVGFMEKNSPEGLENFKSLFMNNIVNKAKTQNGIGFKSLMDSLDSPAMRGKLEKIFSPQEIEKIKDIAELGFEHGDVISNPSRTEVTRGFKDIAKSVKDKADLDMMLGSMRKRAENPNGLPIEQVNQGQTLIPKDVAPLPKPVVQKPAQVSKSDTYKEMLLKLGKDQVSEQKYKSLSNLMTQWEKTKDKPVSQDQAAQMYLNQGNGK